jgi:nitrilase
VAELAPAERDAGGPLRRFLSGAAREHGVLLVGGTIPVADGSPAERPRAACFLYAEDGSELARYDKIHLFDVELPDAQRHYRESDTYAHGERLVCVPTRCGLLGLGVCYDLRFPEMFRALGERGMDVLALPSAFTRLTGAAHWHVLLRARAIENQVYVVAAGQGGRHSATRETWGGSAIIDPWGRVLASVAEGEAVISAAVDPAALAEVRARLPVRAHRRIYAAD